MKVRPRPISAARRRWVFRSTALLGLTAVVLCFLVAWRRDQTTIQLSLDQLAKPVAFLQAHVDSLGRLPATPPAPSGEEFAFYVSDADRYYAAATSEPMIIASTAPPPLVFMKDGRAVILFEKGKIRATWMAESAYQAAWAEQDHRIREFERERKAEPIVLP